MLSNNYSLRKVGTLGRLYTLPNMIILKWMGYDDYVLNFPKIQEQACHFRLKEKHYRKV
jgi:hypothetical protein